MPGYNRRQRLAAEFLGTALLVATVAGSGIMAENLTRDVALALLANTLATGAILVVLITILGPISGAHFNPAVSLVFALKGDLPATETIFYAVAQTSGGIAGVLGVHLMFGLPVFELSRHIRTGGAQCLGWWGFTSPPPIGSPPRPRSRTPRWRSHAVSPTAFPASARLTCQASSPRKSSAPYAGLV